MKFSAIFSCQKHLKINKIKTKIPNNPVLALVAACLKESNSVDNKAMCTASYFGNIHINQIMELAQLSITTYKRWKWEVNMSNIYDMCALKYYNILLIFL